MANALVRQDQPLAEQIEQVVVSGDLSNLSATQRVSYYHKVCESVGLNPLTRPFEYLKLNGKLILYARRDAADQLRTIHGISLSKPQIEYIDDLIVVTVEASNKQGRTDADLGAVSCKGLQGEAKANAMMKAITKAKRRVTLSLAGLGWLDDTEVDSIPGAQRVVVDTETGEIVDAIDSRVLQGIGSDHGEDNSGDADNPSNERRVLASQSQRNRMHALGMEYYKTKENWEKKRPQWVRDASGGAVESSNDLTPEQVDWIVSLLEQRIAKRAAANAQEAIATVA